MIYNEFFHGYNFFLLYLEGIPVEVAEKLENIGLVITARGGHIGFMEGIWPLKTDQYMFKLFRQFFHSTLVKEKQD